MGTPENRDGGGGTGEGRGKGGWWGILTGVSLPADVLWGSFVTYSFLPTEKSRGGEMNA